MRTQAEALAWIRRVRLATASAHFDGVPCFAEAVAGGRIKGSWWGHPKGRLIFTLGEALGDADEVMGLKLLEGKATLLHCSLWPALLAVVLDEAWRTARAKTIPPGARTLWRKVEKASVRGAAKAEADALEGSLLVHCASEHTDKGRHEKRLTAWSRWAAAREIEPTPGGPEAGLRALREFAGGHRWALE